MQSAKGHTKSTIQTKREAEIRELKAKREELKRKRASPEKYVKNNFLYEKYA